MEDVTEWHALSVDRNSAGPASLDCQQGVQVNSLREIPAHPARFTDPSPSATFT